MLPSRSVRTLGFAALLALVVPPASAQDAHEHAADHAHGGDLGTVHLEVSCGPGVQADFDRAVALLHHMMYDQARAAFGSIAERDPDCAMALWGIATTRFQPLWPTRPSAEDLRRGWEEIERARALEPPTDLERDLIAATHAFYREPESAGWWTRIERWADAMAEAYADHPDHAEVGAFYALGQLAIGPTTDDRMAHHARAAEVLHAIHERIPEHPGAIHYTIHANDVDARAGESLEVVRSYDDIAPSVPHALHMPTHIFVRLGVWPDVIEWNRRSADAALEASGEAFVSHHYPHATDYLLYAHLQRGDDDRAADVLGETLDAGPFQRSFVSAFHLASMPARFAVERRAWEEAAALEVRSPEYLDWDRFPWPEAIAVFARGLGAVHTGELDAAREAEARLAVLRDTAESRDEDDFARYIEVDRRILAGWLAHAEGDEEAAVERLREAVELDATVQKHPVTPGAVLPPHEALGDLLMALDRPAEAHRAYMASLEVWPGRYRSILGAARAARAEGDLEAAEHHDRQLLEIVDEGSERPGVAEARART